MHLSGAVNINDIWKPKTMQEGQQLGWELVSKRDALLSHF